MTKEQILIEGLKTYLEDPSRRSLVHRNCAFNGSNGNHCFVGQFMPDKLKKLGESMPHNYSDVHGLLSHYEDELLNHPVINEENLEFLLYCQSLHDANDHWTEDSISVEGIKYLEKIIDKFKLNREQIFSQLNLEP